MTTKEALTTDTLAEAIEVMKRFKAENPDISFAFTPTHVAIWEADRVTHDGRELFKESTCNSLTK